jgi:hypothetical protein
MLALTAVISTLHLTGAVPVADGDYLVVPFDVPAGTVEFALAARRRLGLQHPRLGAVTGPTASAAGAAATDESRS